MKQGDFSKLAKHYVNRPGYSIDVLLMLANTVLKNKKNIIADVGAGTGKLTENLLSIGLNGYAIEPNDEMRNEGIKAFENINEFIWKKGSAEETGLDDNSVNWVLMGSSFHWTNTKDALKEFHRILKPGGYFTAIWNPRDIERSEFHKSIENKIYEMIPNLKRVSSGSSKNMTDLDEKMLSTEWFDSLIFVEAQHTEIMSKERYMGAWKSVNDIQAQAGEKVFLEVLDMIEKEIKDLENIIVPYKTRAWTVRVKK